MNAVFVVDADPSVREALARVIVSDGLAVRACCSVDEVLQLWGGAPDSCALIDCSLARGWSPRAQSRLRAVSGALPIIAIAAVDAVGTRRVARRVGAQAFFRKPVDADALLDAIRWALHAEGSPPP